MANQFGTPGTVRLVKPRTVASQIYTATQWAWVSMLKHSSGIVVVGTSSELQPNTAGGGAALPAGQNISWLLSPGTNLFAVASTGQEAMSLYTVLLDVIPMIVELLGGKGPVTAQQRPVPQTPRLSATVYPGTATWKGK